MNIRLPAYPYKLLIPVFLFMAACQSPTEQASAPKGPAPSPSAAYDEPYRLQAHFSPPANWMNDPNGMFFLDGTYHLFYQYYPDSTVWGPMHWGHATSPNLIHWQNEAVALYPDELGYIFSGSAVVDRDNTSGLGSIENPPVVAIFTHHNPAGEKAEGVDTFQYQSIAYSLDKGYTWTKYAENPVLSNPGIRDFRDPKVFWHEASQAWVMILAVKDRVHLYRSPNLTDWTFASEFGIAQGSHGGVWECPDLFELPLAGTDQSKWVMLVSLGGGAPNGGSGTQYFVGEFDGSTFTNAYPADETLWLDYGTDNYAGVSWTNIPAAAGRRLFIGWLSNWTYAQIVPTETWRSAMTLPRTLTLIASDKGPVLQTDWVQELRQIERKPIPLPTQKYIKGSYDLIPPSQADTAYRVDIRLHVSEASEVGLEFFNSVGEMIQVGYNRTTQTFFVDRSKAGRSGFHDEFAARHVAPWPLADDQIDIRVVMDASAIEVIAAGGQLVMTEVFFPGQPLHHVRAYSKGGEAQIVEGQYTGLQSIW